VITGGRHTSGGGAGVATARYHAAMIDSTGGETSRRRFVASGAALGAALALGPGVGRMFAQAGQRWFKIGICDWMLGRTNPTVLKLAKEIGVDGVQLNMGTLANDMHLRKPEVRQVAAGSGATGAVTGVRQVYFDDWVETRIYDRSRLGAGDVVDGPAVLEEFSSTVPVHPGFRAEVDRFGNLVIRRCAS